MSSILQDIVFVPNVPWLNSEEIDRITRRVAGQSIVLQNFLYPTCVMEVYHQQHPMWFVFRLLPFDEIACKVNMTTPQMNRFIKDYELLCSTFRTASYTAPPDKLEAFDMARRSLHNEAASWLLGHFQRLDITITPEIARHLFTLVHILKSDFCR